MHAVGIICEYNPFHHGHAHQLAAAKADSGADVTIAVMSEYLTQRGEPAIADPYTRARAAVACGADLVVGLPFPYSAAPAEFFALAGVRILHAMGAEALHFGSECADIPRMREAARFLYDPALISACGAWLDAHPDNGILDARTAVCRELGLPAVPGGSNDLLGMAYLHAVDQVAPEMAVMTTRRIGAAYGCTALSADGSADEPAAGVTDESARSATGKPATTTANESAKDTVDEPAAGTASESARQFPDSATALRESWLRDGLSSLRGRIPTAGYAELCRAVERRLAPVRPDALGQALLSHYRLADPRALAAYAGLDGGVAERLCAAARKADSYAAMLSLAATKRYTHARLRRALWYGVCQVSGDLLASSPAYVRLLAANRTGRAYLSALRKTCPLPILTKPSRLPNFPDAIRQHKAEERMESLYALALPAPASADIFAKASPFIAREGSRR